MPDLNKFRGADLITEDGFDALTVTDMGDGVVAFVQTAEDGTLHNVIIGEAQAAALITLLQKAIQ